MCVVSGSVSIFVVVHIVAVDMSPSIRTVCCTLRAYRDEVVDRLQRIISFLRLLADLHGFPKIRHHIFAVADSCTSDFDELTMLSNVDGFMIVH